jgi:hypothetical protein
VPSASIWSMFHCPQVEEEEEEEENKQAID